MTAASPQSAPRRGLTTLEARALRSAQGPNRLPKVPGPPVLLELARQFVHFFALLLWVTTVLAMLAGMPQLAAAIVIVIVLNGTFAFAQEYRARRAAHRLGELLPQRVMALRDGQWQELDAIDLVEGDVVRLTPGDRVPADLTLFDVEALALDTSALTGESVPMHPEEGQTVSAGTFATGGEASGQVIATGSRTRLAGIARLTREEPQRSTPLAQELNQLVRVVATIAIGIGLTFLGIALVIGIPWNEGLIFAIGVTVALVPEGLLPTVTLSLAMTAQRMAARNALVRRLDSVETLGATTVICTDKTGTLTQNTMSVVAVWTPAGTARVDGQGYEPVAVVQANESTLPAVRKAACTAARCSTGRAVLKDGAWIPAGDPMEAALDVLARRLGADPDGVRESPEAARFPFDAERRRMSVVADGAVLVKGAPESVLPLCTVNDGADLEVERFAAEGLRVIAVAERPLRPDDHIDAADDVEQDLTLLGLIGLHDPPRPNAANAVAACREAGIRIIMVTGDHPATAAAIALAVGLLLPDSPEIEAHQLPMEEIALGLTIDKDGTVISRATPEDKVRIAKALQLRGHVVAMTGDGVNDGPALTAADVGVAMGRSGTDVARAAADLVLLDDDFASIVTAVALGRTTFKNARRFLTYHLTDNVAELAPFVLWALSGGRFPLALGVLQVLALDVGTDVLPSLALGAEPPHSRGMTAPIRNQRLVDGRLLRRVFAVLGPTEAIAEIALFLATFTLFGWRFGEPLPSGNALLAASGAAFASVVLSQAANAFACRSESRWAGALGWRTNPYLLAAVAAEMAILGLLLLVPPFPGTLGHTAPPWEMWPLLLLSPATVLAIDTAHKGVQRRRIRRQEATTEPPPTARLVSNT